MSEVEKNIQTAKNFEIILLEKEERLKKLAWFIAFVSLVIAMFSVVAITIMLPLKNTEIELWSVDKQSGRYEYMTRIKERDISAETALAKFMAADYVTSRERYNYFSLQDDYKRVRLLSGNDVRRDYVNYFSGDNAPDVIYEKAKYTVTIDIISNVHAPATKPDSLATLRFRKTIRRIADGSEKYEYWNVRMTYQYLPRKELTELQRESDPLGFIVTSYQLDKELRSE